MPYAELDDVLARAGSVRGAWTDASEPSLPEIEAFLADGAATIDAIIEAAGSVPPLAGTPTAMALRDANAYYALARALRATPRAATQQMVDEAQGAWGAAEATLLDGSHPALTLLASERTPRAGSLWTDEQQYQVVPEGMSIDPRVDPVAWRGMAL